jgi:hypothetical protein
MNVKRMLVSSALTIMVSICLNSTVFAQSPVVVENSDTSVCCTADANVNYVSASSSTHCAATGCCRARLNNGVIDTPFEKMLFPGKSCCPWNNPIAIRCRR